jgi:hypothetical protein
LIKSKKVCLFIFVFESSSLTLEEGFT